jgi:hypothetical protein
VEAEAVSVNIFKSLSVGAIPAVDNVIYALAKS